MQRVKAIKANYPLARQIISGHMNCPDGGIALPTSLTGVLPRPSMGAMFKRKDQTVYWIRKDNIVMKRSTPEGRKFSLDMAKLGLLPIDGVSGMRKPS